ncbi:MAG: hypothetical protein Q8K30_00125 [Candidatus Gracilibacteria bacterium]|nr:hypothetical protein [Candidatus Gracilibacteria bacterium]
MKILNEKEVLHNFIIEKQEDLCFGKMQNTKIILKLDNIALIQLCILNIYGEKLEKEGFKFEIEIQSKDVIKELEAWKNSNPFAIKLLNKHKIKKRIVI